MKKIYTMLFVSILLASCSGNDDNPGNSSNDISTADFLPLTTGNYWVYDVENSQQQGSDHLYIDGDMTLNGHSYKKFTTTDLPLGLFSNAIYNDGIRKEGDKLLLSGMAEFGFSEEFMLNIPITDFMLLKENASAGQQLGITSGTITQPYEGYDLQFVYTLSTKNIQDLNTHTAGQHTYTHVKQVETVLNLKVTALVTVEGIGTVPIGIMAPQNVLVSNQFYADGVGVVHVASDINYQLQDFSVISVDLPIPQSASEHQEEVLNNYMVQ